jgi:hypothetical protein
MVDILESLRIILTLPSEISIRAASCVSANSMVDSLEHSRERDDITIGNLDWKQRTVLKSS